MPNQVLPPVAWTLFPKSKSLMEHNPSRSTSHPSTFDVNNSPAIYLPGSLSSKAKAKWICKHSWASSDASDADLQNGPDEYLPGSTPSKAKAGSKSKFLGNSLD
jgi:hypothetical protein